MEEEKIEDINIKEIVDKVKNDIESYMMEDMEHQNKEIEYILYNANTKETQVIASDKIEEMILFAPFTKEEENGYINIPEWDFNFDEYLFKELQNGYEIAYMSNDTHYGIWIAIDELYPEEFEYKDGIIKYFKYCKDNNITKKYLDNEVKMNIPDIMKYTIDDTEQCKNNKTRKLDNGIIVIDLGYRREEPIALVQRGDGDNMEYVVAFNYRIKDNKMDWAYGYYYNKNLSKATEDFKKVIAGGNLDKTFEKKQNKKRNERSR